MLLRQENGRVVRASPELFQLDPLICLYILFYASLGLAWGYISNISNINNINNIIFKNYNIYIKIIVNFKI